MYGIIRSLTQRSLTTRAPQLMQRARASGGGAEPPAWRSLVTESRLQAAAVLAMGVVLSVMAIYSLNDHHILTAKKPQFGAKDSK